MIVARGDKKQFYYIAQVTRPETSAPGILERHLGDGVCIYEMGNSLVREEEFEVEWSLSTYKTNQTNNLSCY